MLPTHQQALPTFSPPNPYNIRLGVNKASHIKQLSSCTVYPISPCDAIPATICVISSLSLSREISANERYRQHFSSPATTN